MTIEISTEFGLNRELLAESGLFDVSAYLEQAGEDAATDPIGHYLKKGWRVGLEPNRSFPGSVLMSCFRSIHLMNQPPAITYLMLCAAGWNLPGTREELEQRATLIRNTGLFDSRYYATQIGAGADKIDPVLHYVVVGEQLGIRPSQDFDPSYYRARYPDVASPTTGYLVHYAVHGRAEGRNPTPANIARAGRAEIDLEKENIIVVAHDGTRSGAPILAWNIAGRLAKRYNIFSIVLGSGELLNDFEEISVELYGPLPESRRNETDVEYSLRSLLEARKYRYAIVNSAASYTVVEPCARRFIPTLLLIHEFASYLGAGLPLRRAMDSATEIVFPANLVKEAAEETHSSLRGRILRVMPQGMSMVPAGRSAHDQKGETSMALERIKLERESKNVFVVLGVGPIELRKGVDLFLATASAVLRRQSHNIHFLWVGDRRQSAEDTTYSVFIEEQVRRSGLAQRITFLNSIPDLEPVYQIADAFLLSSRLDPLPNVTIDSALRGIPVVCFKNASGMAELLLNDIETADCVQDYVDADGVANVLIQLANDAGLKERISRAIQRLAHRTFDMEAYVSRLDVLGREAETRMHQRAMDAETLVADPSFDQDMFLGPSPVVETRHETVIRYLATGGECDWSVLPSLSYRRRPSPGFNPRIYAAAHPEILRKGADPLADFIRQGRPPGPWQVAVLRPDDRPVSASSCTKLRVALHAHLFYPDLCSDFLAHLTSNQTPCDLLVSTDTSSKAASLKESLSTYRNGNVELQVVPNRGRDIGALLTGFRDEVERYDLIGHVHGKRSPYVCDVNAAFTWGDGWREFLWQNMLGGLYPMMDQIIAAFERQRDLGLIFPSDPNVCGWDGNRMHADALAARMGWLDGLPDHFDFPVGTMFWVRLPALRPLLSLGFKWDDYPQEPVAQDGTLLHAIERLPIIACRLAGLTHAVTHVSGVSWMPPT